MWKLAHYPSLLLWIALGVTAAFLLLCSCDEVEHHKMLTFFFDGVPPLPGEAGGPGSADANAVKAAGSSPTDGWHVHKPLSNCTACHGDRRRQVSSRQVQLVASVPQLCHKCHQEYAALEGWVHGPVATGECLLCHEPHKARNEFLLIKPVPDLCHDCHDRQAIRLIEGHADESYARCTDCHEGHAGATKSLLKPVFLEKPAGRTYLAEVRRVQYDEATRRARSDLLRGDSLPAMLETTAGYVETGKLWSAKAYLEVIRDSDTLTDGERSRVAEVLQQIAALSELQAPEHPGGSDDGTSLAAAQTRLAAALRAIRDERTGRESATADRYYGSIKAYHAGRLAEAREGFLDVLKNRSLPAPMREMAQDYLEKIEWLLKEPQRPGR